MTTSRQPGDAILRAGGIRRVLRWSGLVYVLAALLSFAAAAFAMKLWHANWAVPFYGGGDANLMSSAFKTVAETGWYEVQHLLGAPNGQIYFDWRETNNLNFVWAKLLDFIFGNPFVAENVYYIIGFPLAGLTAAWFFRVVGLSRFLAVTMAILFAIAPYHFVRNEAHLWYSEYYLVPLAMVLLYRVLNGEQLWGRREGSRFARGIFTGRGAQTVVILALFGSQNTQFAVFAILILAIVGIIALIRTRVWWRFVGAAIAGVVLVVVLLINLAPPLLYFAIHGENVQAVVRSPSTSFGLSLRVSDLLLPVSGDRIHILNTIRSEYDAVFGGGEEAVLGLVASIGFVIALIVILSLIVVRRRPDRSLPLRDRFRSNALANLSVLTLVALLISMVGGLSFLVTLFTSDIRGWNRISIFIALLSLGVTGMAIEYCVVRFAAKRDWSRLRRSIIMGAASVILISVGFFDQTVPGYAIPSYATNNATFAADGRFVSTIEKSVPTGAAILQLPFRRFPETPTVNGVYDSDQLMPYLHSSTLRWSGGGIKGRALAEWQGQLGRLPMRQLLVSAAAAGFSGVVVDAQEYGASSQSTLDSITAELGNAVVADRGRFVYFPLTAAAADAQAHLSRASIATIGNRTTHAVYPYFVPDVPNDGFAFLPTILSAYKPRIVLDNPSSVPRKLTLSFTITYLPGGVLDLGLPGGGTETIQLTQATASVSIDITAPPGVTSMPFSQPSGVAFARTDGINGLFSLTSVVGTDPVLTTLLAPVAGAK